jgi:hypothetical protein
VELVVVRIPVNRVHAVATADLVIPGVAVDRVVVVPPEDRIRPIVSFDGRPAFVEDLVHPEPISRGPIALTDPTWCGVEALVARADQKTERVSPTTTGTSMRFVGTWRSSGEATPFSWTSTLHHSASGPLVWEGAGPHGHVSVQRTLTGLFDCIDFDSPPHRASCVPPCRTSRATRGSHSCGASNWLRMLH